MKLSRCVSLQLLGLLLVVEGAEEYRLGAGRIYFAAPSDCPADWTKLWLRGSLEEVREFAKTRNISVTGRFGTTDQPKNVVVVYESGDERSFSENGNTGIFFDSLNKQMMLYTKDTSRSAVYDYIRNQIVRSKGQFVLQDNGAMDSLQFLGGCTVCIQEQTVIDQFKTDNPCEELWAQKANAFFMRDKTLTIEQKNDTVFNILLSDKQMQCNVRNGTAYNSSKFRFVVVFNSAGCNVIYVNAWSVVATKKMVEIMSAKLKKPLVFDESCHQFAPLYLPGGQSISAVLAELPAVKKLGDVAAWSKTFKPLAE
eukprot:GHVS01068699.1.p1 GENE.GHVS01068699.1~~GHVS01068699.1.p1  ORF type:complete len:311 (+),score=17.88 GHVS01068699.1:166-1098(+)